MHAYAVPLTHSLSRKNSHQHTFTQELTPATTDAFVSAGMPRSGLDATRYHRPWTLSPNVFSGLYATGYISSADVERMTRGDAQYDVIAFERVPPMSGARRHSTAATKLFLIHPSLISQLTIPKPLFLTTCHTHACCHRAGANRRVRWVPPPCL